MGSKFDIKLQAKEVVINEYAVTVEAETEEQALEYVENILKEESPEEVFERCEVTESDYCRDILKTEKVDLDGCKGESLTVLLNRESEAEVTIKTNDDEAEILVIFSKIDSECGWKKSMTFPFSYKDMSDTLGHGARLRESNRFEDEAGKYIQVELYDKKEVKGFFQIKENEEGYVCDFFDEDGDHKVGIFGIYKGDWED